MPNTIRSEDQQIPAGDTGKLRKPYCKPQLMELGDLRTLTLGVSPTGFFDSGGGFLYEDYSYPTPRF
ncbi:MAG TPA: hypothetical protein VII93_11785, partial [Anaerolineales bacterium]